MDRALIGQPSLSVSPHRNSVGAQPPPGRALSVPWSTVTGPGAPWSDPGRGAPVTGSESLSRSGYSGP